MYDSKGRETKYLADKVHNTDSYLPVRATGPLHEPLPWVIELRVVGTAATLQVQVHETMMIGRADPQRGIIPAVDLSPYNGQSMGVSRQHAVIMVKDNRICLKDLGSVNGTRLNGSLLAPETEYRLRHGDEMTIGHMRLQVRFTVVPTIGVTPKGTTSSLDAPVPRIARGETALIVQDDADVANVFNLSLRQAGFNVTVVDSAASAIAYISHQFPHLLVMELMLPDMNGLDLLRYIRKQPGNEQIRVICSGASGGFQMHQAMDAGAQVFIAKPVSVEDLLKAATKALDLNTELIIPQV